VITCDKVKMGEWRYLTTPEVAGLRKLVGL
jgi:hypothetical protein